MARVSDHAKCGLGPSSHDRLWIVSFFDGEAQLSGCLRKPEGIPLRGRGGGIPLSVK